MTPRRLLIAAVCALALVAAGTSSTAAIAPVDNTAVVYDVYGQRLDAHDGDLLQAPDGTIWLYGTAYGCGFQLGTRSPYCGVRVYTTTDLRTWTPAGAVGGQYAFDHLADDWQAACTAPSFGCFRPHVVRRPADGRYVMWLNVAGQQGYRVLVSDTPAGPFVDTGATPALAVQPVSGLRYGDEDVTIAPDGRGYVTYTAIDPATNAHTLVIEQLDATLTTGTGRHVVVDTGTDPQMLEAPALFYGPTDVWYLAYSDPARPYGVTGSGILNGPSGTPDPIGAYTWPRTLTVDSCSGQPTGVWPITGPSGATTFVYGSDRWVPGAANQATANDYYGALTFTANGGTAIDAYTCQAGWSLS